MFEKKAMLVELTIHQWTARKHDKRVTSEVDRGHNAKVPSVCKHNNGNK